MDKIVILESLSHQQRSFIISHIYKESITEHCKIKFTYFDITRILKLHLNTELIKLFEWKEANKEIVKDLLWKEIYNSKYKGLNSLDIIDGHNIKKGLKEGLLDIEKVIKAKLFSSDKYKGLTRIDIIDGCPGNLKTDLKFERIPAREEVSPLVFYQDIKPLIHIAGRVSFQYVVKYTTEINKYKDWERIKPTSKEEYKQKLINIYSHPPVITLYKGDEKAHSGFELRTEVINTQGSWPKLETDATVTRPYFKKKNKIDKPGQILTGRYFRRSDSTYFGDPTFAKPRFGLQCFKQSIRVRRKIDKKLADSIRLSFIYDTVRNITRRSGVRGSNLRTLIYIDEVNWDHWRDPVEVGIFANLHRFPIAFKNICAEKDGTFSTEILGGEYFDYEDFHESKPFIYSRINRLLSTTGQFWWSGGPKEPFERKLCLICDPPLESRLGIDLRKAIDNCWYIRNNKLNNTEEFNKNFVNPSTYYKPGTQIKFYNTSIRDIVNFSKLSDLTYTGKRKIEHFQQSIEPLISAHTQYTFDYCPTIHNIR